MSRRERLGRLGLLVCYTLLCLWGFSIAGQLSFLSPGISLRYSSYPLSGEDALLLLEKSAATSFQPALWRWDKQALRAGTESFDILWYTGEGANVYPASFIEGGYPSPADEKGIALSRPLAYALYGSQQNVLGQTVELGNKTYFVRGVFESEDSFALACCPPEKDGAFYTGVELAGTGSRQEALTFLNGLPQPDILLDLPLLLQIAWLAALLPPCAGLCILAWRALRARGVPKRWIGYTLFAAACLGCGSFLSILPAWLVPSRWSDFSFWGDLAAQFGEDARQWLSLGAGLRDIHIKLTVFLLLPVVLGGLFCAVKLALLPGRKTKSSMLPASTKTPGPEEAPPDSLEKPAGAEIKHTAAAAGKLVCAPFSEDGEEA